MRFKDKAGWTSPECAWPHCFHLTQWVWSTHRKHTVCHFGSLGKDHHFRCISPFCRIAVPLLQNATARSVTDRSRHVSFLVIYLYIFWRIFCLQILLWHMHSNWFELCYFKYNNSLCTEEVWKKLYSSPSDMWNETTSKYLQQLICYILPISKKVYFTDKKKWGISSLTTVQTFAIFQFSKWLS